MSLILAACLLSQLPGALELDPRLSWYTLETDRFAVHFSASGAPDEQTESLAAHVALLAEQTHDRLTLLTGWTPASRTEIVIADFFDYANGWAAPLPDNTITIIPAIPAGSRTGFDDWLRTLLVHEYAHIIQMDMARGVPAFLRRVLGRAVLPNALAPVWLLEGYALHTETRAVGYGRTRSAEYDMMMRAAADAGSLLPLDRCGNYELTRWPRGNAPYLYGGLFFAHLAKTDRTAADRYILARSGGIPYFDNVFARRVFGRNFDRLWTDWQSELTRRADEVRKELVASGLTNPTILTLDELAASAPLWSRSGTEVYYVSRTGREYPAIKAVDRATGAVRTLHEGRVVGNLALSPDGRLLAFGRFALTRTTDYSDIHCLNLQTGELTRLTFNMRARDPDFSPDSSSLVFVSNRHGRNDLILLDLATGEYENLTESEDHVGYSSPRFSPDGRFIAVAVNRPGEAANIEVMDRQSGWTIPVTQDLANNISPFWSKTGKNLFFSSDRTGVCNIHAWSAESDQVRQCTNVLYGVFAPAVAPDNRHVALVSHSATGDDIALIPLDAETWRPAPVFADTLLASPIPERPGSDTTHPHPDIAARRTFSPLYHYSPFPTILPKLWLPFAWYDREWQLGAFTFGWDAIQSHRYAAAAGWRFGGGPFGTASYEYRALLPLIAAEVSADANRQDGSLTLSVPFVSDQRSSNIALSSRRSHDSTLAAGYGLSLATSNARAYRFAAAPAEGIHGGLSTDLNVKAALGARNRCRIIAYAAGFIGSHSKTERLSPFLPWSLRLQGALGTGLGDASRDSSWLLPSDNSVIGVRGLGADTTPGRNLAAAALRFRAPLAWPERGLSTAPVFLRGVSAQVYCQTGMTWNDWLPQQDELRRLRTGLGAELHAEVIVGHLLPASLTLGYARGISPQPGSQFYVELRSSLLSALLDRPDPDRLDPKFLRN